MINRRKFLGISAGAGAALTLTPQLLRALHQGQLMQRAIPSTSEMLPVVSFSPQEEADNAAMKGILKTLLDNGGKVVDVLHGGGEQVARTAASELGTQERLFWTTPVVGSPPRPPGAPPPPKADAAAIRAQVETRLATFKVPRIDLVLASAYSVANDPTYLAVLREMKKEGKIRYVGVHELLFPPNSPVPATAQLESIMRNEQVDFIGTDYSLSDRRVEETILPLAQERKIAFMAYFPFDRGRGLRRAANTPLPEWAAEFDARTWAQFFLKYVLSHPAVIVARTGTTRAEHMLDNIGGGIGRLPNEATRKRMAQLVDSLPPPPAPPPVPGEAGIALSAAILERYVGQWKTPSGNTITFRREGTRLFVKPGNNPEVPLNARSETRLQDPRGPVFEFQVDGQGKVTGLILEQGNPVQRVPLTRIS